MSCKTAFDVHVKVDSLKTSSGFTLTQNAIGALLVLSINSGALLQLEHVESLH